MLGEVFDILGVLNNLNRWRMFAGIIGAVLGLFTIKATTDMHLGDAAIYSMLGFGIVLGTAWDYAARRKWNLKECMSVALVGITLAVIGGGIFTAAFFFITKAPLEYASLIGSSVGLMLFLFTMQKFGG